MTLARILVLATCTLLAGCRGAARPPRSAPAPHMVTAPLPVATPELASWIDTYASGFGREWGPAYAPSGYLVVAKDGVPIVSRAYGKPSPNARTNRIGPSTRFQIGSLTKQFTAVAVLQLVDKKRAKLTDTIRTYVPELPPSFDAVTLQHLLTQTSGIASYTSDPALTSIKHEKIPRSRILASFTGAPLAFRPGEKFDYSNSNYFLLGLVLEKVTGTTYEEALQASVLRPAGMARSSTAFDPTAFDSASGTVVDEKEQIRLVDTWDTPLPFAAGALRSSAIDLLAWDRALASGRLLRPETETRRTTPEKDDYACGVIVRMRNGHRVEWHNGGVEGFSSYFARVPDLGLAVVFLSNSGQFDATTFGSDVTKMILDAKALPPRDERPIGAIDPAVAASLAGTYDLLPASREKLEAKLPKALLDSVASMTIAVDEKRLSVKPSGHPSPFLAFPARDRAPAFFTKTSGIELVPSLDASGKVTGFRFEQAGLVLDYVRSTRGT